MAKRICINCKQDIPKLVGSIKLLYNIYDKTSNKTLYKNKGSLCLDCLNKLWEVK